MDQLKKLGANPPATNVGREAANTQLENTIGALSHYVGDMHQPLHTTHYHNWQLAFPGRGGSHGYLEGSLFQGRDYPNWQKRLLQKEKGKARQTLSFAQVQERVLRQIEAGYLRVFDLVATDKKARTHQTQAVGYFKEIRKEWKDIASDRMEDSARTLSDVLHSAYIEAGRPDMTALALRSEFKKPSKRSAS